MCSGCLLPLTFASLMLLEFGILIVPLVAVGWWLRRRASPGAGWPAPWVEWRVCRVRRLLGVSVDLGSPESGLGFDDVSPQQIKQIFAHAPWLFWLYNIASSLLTVIRRSRVAASSSLCRRSSAVRRGSRMSIGRAPTECIVS